MSNTLYIIICLIIMAGITYLLRVVPIIVFDKKIKNRWVRSFLFYVPYAVLAAMAFPAIFLATDNTIASIAGTVVAVVLAFVNGNMFLVALGSAVAVLIASLFL